METHSSLSFDPTVSKAPPRILVVEPNKSNLSVMVRRLWEAGYRVTAAQSGTAAIAELHRLAVDAVVAELNMERIDGAELVRMIRDEVMWRDIPVMLITGRSDPAGAVRAYEAGADDVIVKPFHFEVLFARLERRLARTRALKALRDVNAVLDGRVVERAIEIGELRDELKAARAL